MNDELTNEHRSSDLKPTFGESPQHSRSGSKISVFITKYRKQKKNVHQHIWRLRIPNCSTEKTRADSAFLSKTGWRIYFQCVCSCIPAGSDILYQGQPAEESFLPVHHVTTSLGSRETEQAWKAGSPLIWCGQIKGMIQKVRKTEVNSSLESKDMQLDGMIQPILRSIRSQPLKLKTPYCRTFLLPACTKLRTTADTSSIQNPQLQIRSHFPNTTA